MAVACVACGTKVDAGSPVVRCFGPGRERCGEVCTAEYLGEQLRGDQNAGPVLGALHGPAAVKHDSRAATRNNLHCRPGRMLFLYLPDSPALARFFAMQVRM